MHGQYSEKLVEVLGKKCEFAIKTVKITSISDSIFQSNHTQNTILMLFTNVTKFKFMYVA